MKRAYKFKACLKTYPREDTWCGPVESCAKQGILYSGRQKNKNAAASENQTYSSADMDRNKLSTQLNIGKKGTHPASPTELARDEKAVTVREIPESRYAEHKQIVLKIHLHAPEKKP